MKNEYMVLFIDIPFRAMIISFASIYHEKSIDPFLYSSLGFCKWGTIFNGDAVHGWIDFFYINDEKLSR